MVDKIGLFYATTTGNTERVAEKIKREFKKQVEKDVVELHNIVDPSAAKFLDSYTIYIFGVSTWYEGDFQDFWKIFLPVLEEKDLKGKVVALFGLGDQVNHGNYFVDAMGKLYELLVSRGAQVIGFWSIEGYNFKNSKAVRNGKFVGLAIDEDNQSHLTDERVKKWVAQLIRELGWK